MRQFVVVGHDAPTDPEFSLDDLPGAGRVDLLARCVTAGLLTSHGIRDDARVHLVLDDEFTITVDGSSVRGLHPDERSAAALLRGALEQRADAIGHQPVETSPGIELRRRGLEPTITDLARDGAIVTLAEDGDSATETEPPADPVFVLSDHRTFPDDERALLTDVATATVSLGPVALHADHAIAVAHNWVDTEGYASD